MGSAETGNRPPSSAPVTQTSSTPAGSPSGESQTQRTPAPAQRVSDETLLSAPAPAERFDVELEDRIRALEQQLEELSFRLGVLEQSSKLSSPRQSWLLFVLFFVGLALSYELLFAR